jgi:hypothetical protein
MFHTSSMSLRASASRPARILHAPWNTAGNPVGLSRAERELGFVSDVAVFEPHEFGYDADLDLGVGSADTWEARRRKLRFLLWAIPRYDVFHFNFAYSIMTSFHEDRVYSELRFLRLIGKKILATFQGDDARPPEDNPFGPKDPVYLAWQARYQRQKCALLLKHAHRCFFINPDLRHYLPGAEFRPYANIDPRRITPVPPPSRDSLVVAHAPSHRGIKGTEHVIEAVEALRRDGVRIELDLVEGVTRRQVLERVAAADLAIDQLNLGWYGGFAVECMALSRPVLCYLREDEPEDNPFGEKLPIVNTNPGTLQDDLRALAGDPDRLRRIGAESRRFVEWAHDPRAVARQNLDGLVPIPDRATTAPQPQPVA